MWFSPSQQGISTNNIRALAKIFSAGDPDLFLLWQASLTSANRANRRNRKENKSVETTQSPRAVSPPLVDRGIVLLTNILVSSKAAVVSWIIVLFSVSLGIISQIIGINSVVLLSSEGFYRQVGYLWAPNWTITFFLLLPLFILFASRGLTTWREHIYVSSTKAEEQTQGFMSQVVSYRSIFLAIFFVTVILASLSNWYLMYIQPLMTSNVQRIPLDWRLSPLYIDSVSRLSVYIFSLLAFTMNALGSFVFFIYLLYIHISASINKANYVQHLFTNEVDASAYFRYVASVSKSSILGIAICLTMKLQSSYIQSASTSIVDWLFMDIIGALYEQSTSTTQAYVNFTLFNDFSFYCLCSIVAVNTIFISQNLHIKPKLNTGQSLSLISLIMTKLIGIIAYITIGVVEGFALWILVFSLLSLIVLAYPMRHHHDFIEALSP